jgi:hypothetical protein
MRALILSELRLRMRGKRWWILLVVWTLVLFGLLFMVRSAAINALRRPVFIDGPVVGGSLSYSCASWSRL